jgi:hypothetical protein
MPLAWRAGTPKAECVPLQPLTAGAAGVAGGSLQWLPSQALCQGAGSPDAASAHVLLAVVGVGEGEGTAWRGRP